MGITLIIILAAFLILFYFFRIGDAFSPWFITTGIWLVMILLLNIGETGLYQLQSRFYICTFLWVPILSATAILTYYSTPAYREEEKDETHINFAWLNFFFIISLIFTPIYVFRIIKIVTMFGTEDLLSNLRILADAGQEDTIGTLLKYISAFNQALFIVCIWFYRQVGKIRMVIITIANLMCAFAIMEKGSLFFLGLIAMFVLYEKNIIKLRTIALCGIAIIILFYGINIARTTSDQQQNNDSNIFDFIAMYILSPPVAFEQVQQKVTEQFGSRTFAFFYAFLTKLGIANYTIEPKLQPFVFVPVSTNVYTVYQPFYQDFGYNGVAFFASVYGVFAGWVYRKCQQGYSIFMCLYAYIVEVLVLQFFQENLILSLSILTQYLFVFILTLQNKFKLIICKRKAYIKKEEANLR